jgi:alpha-galactosidase
MRHYGNLFRAGDCPNDALRNRVETTDVRLLAGSTATHSDMLMWSPAESVECAALQFLNILFSVPQISVKLDIIPEDHRRMLRFWMTFWKDLRHVLLDGSFEPCHPELHYPFIVAKTPDTWVGAFYADIVAPLTGPLPGEIYLVNATQQPRILIDVGTDSGTYQVEERTVLGQVVDKRVQRLTSGIHPLNVSRSGLLHLLRI